MVSNLQQELRALQRQLDQWYETREVIRQEVLRGWSPGELTRDEAMIELATAAALVRKLYWMAEELEADFKDVAGML